VVWLNLSGKLKKVHVSLRYQLESDAEVSEFLPG
jgi:hypothetical protein